VTFGAAEAAFGFGAAYANWLPLAGDWNGNTVDTIGAYSPESSYFFRNSNTSGGADVNFASASPLQAGCR